MKYYYFDPFKKQYLFPEGFENYSLFHSFFQPYTFSGSILWFFWKKVKLFRSLCLIESIEETVPIHRIKRHLPVSTHLAFNRGTPGKEQKITVLAFNQETKSEFFIKYAESALARNNVANEGEILQQLAHLDFVPRLQSIIDHSCYTMIQTSVLEGKRLINQQIDDQLIEILFQLSKQRVKANRKFTKQLHTCFSHGDFCPWNMILHKGQLNVFDWEMAGYYPAGFDLFTYIFQTSFLLSPKTKIDHILKQNKKLILKYFETLKIRDLQPYLHAFASLKLEVETDKQNWKLVKLYKQLKNYVEMT